MSEENDPKEEPSLQEVLEELAGQMSRPNPKMLMEVANDVTLVILQRRCFTGEDWDIFFRTIRCVYNRLGVDQEMIEALVKRYEMTRDMTDEEMYKDLTEFESEEPS